MVSAQGVKRWASAWRFWLPPLIAGGLAPLSLSPVDLWPLAIVSVAILYVLLDDVSPVHALRTGWLYGLAFFGVGVSWVYVSINVYGNVSGFLAGLLTLLLVAALALLFALQCWLYRRYFNGRWQVLSFAALWLAFEWFRAWFLTGFPWLYLGYAHIHTALAGLAPVFGVLGVSFVVALSASILGHLALALREQRQWRALAQPVPLIGLALLWLAPAALRLVDWVEATDTRIEVAVVQANIDQNMKFDPDFIDQSLGIYEELSEPLWEQDIVVWSETSIPLLYQRAGPELAYFDRLASRNDSSLVTGIFYTDSGRIYNSITSIGEGSGIYHKQKLVPFGEYVPFASFFSSLLRIFDLPMSSLAPGPSGQATLNAAGHSLAPFICYEVVYPDFVRHQALEADFLITISNDTWFGASFGPLQHLQMAAMRALENGKYMVRSTSNGVSAIVDEKGRILARTEQFRAETLSGTVRTFEGRTPFSRWGSWPVLVLGAFALLACLLKTRQLPKRSR